MTSTIALVEDNEDNLLLLEAILSDEYGVATYEDGPTALAGIAASGAALVLLDISLPGMDGIEVLKNLRADPATQALPVVALTAHAMAGDEERFLAEGFDAYFSKPIVDEEALFALIRKLLSAAA